MSGAAGLPAYWLSCHVDYACRHSGACCRSGWPLPVEHAVVAAIDGAVARGTVRTVDGHPEWLDRASHAPGDVSGTFRQAHGGCVFHVPAPSTVPATSQGRHCGLHAALGHAALPVSCQHFPRVCLIDDRAVRVSLSHYCPTAAAMLVDHAAPLTIVSGPPPVPGRAVPEGLDVRGELPPRLTDRVLMDADGLMAWEAHVVAVLAGPSAEAAPERAVARVAADVRRLVRWSPSAGATLAETVAQLAAVGRADDLGTAAARLADARSWVAAYGAVASACPDAWSPDALPEGLVDLDASLVRPVWDQHAPAVRRYLAARAFGAWIVHQADAGESLARWLRCCHAVLRIECARACGLAARPLDRDLLLSAIRRADVLVCHYADALGLAVALRA